jgi:hypothetical protein
MTASPPDAASVMRKAIMMIDRRQKVLAQLDGGARTWDELQALTKVSDESLGLAIGELLDLRKIWTGQRGDDRVYGIERRTGLVPRFAHEPRRADDYIYSRV